jgi:hypothetical protein
LLIEAYNTTKRRVNTRLEEAKKATLGCDGSSDGCQDLITHTAGTTGNLPFLLRKVAHLAEEHTVENIVAFLDQDIADLVKVYNIGFLN